MKPTSRFSLVFGTNIWSHYQEAFVEQLVRLHGTEFVKMALFEPVPEERRRLGWAAESRQDWVIGPPNTSFERTSLHQACIAADVMIFGACDWEVLEARSAAQKLTLVQAERLFKKPGHWLRRFNPRYARGMATFRERVASKTVHALTIGHFAPDDLRAVGVMKGRMWRWGYFPRVPEELLGPRPSRPLQVLWAGRFLPWKRVDTILCALARVQKEPWFGSATLIGGGPDLARMVRLASKLAVNEDKLRFLPAVSPAEVRHWMRASDVYILPSGRGEGWGVVANEAMAEGCVVVANEEAGASLELVEHGRTGYLFRNGNAVELASLLERIGRDPEEAEAVRTRARAHIVANWSPEVAAVRVLQLCAGLLAGDPPDFASGPCAHVPET